MAQFTVYSNLRPSAERAPYLVDVQSDVFDFSSCIVTPLVRREYYGAPINRLNPILAIQGQAYVLSPQELTAASLRDLGPEVGNLSYHRDAIIAALDMLFTGI